MIAALMVGMSCGAAHAQAEQQPASDGVAADRAALLADASSRVSLYSSEPGSAGHGGRFFVRSADESFELNIGGLIQLRYLASFGADGPDPRDDDPAIGFQLRRTRLDFRGHVGSKDLRFRVQAEFGRGDGELDVLDAYVDRQLGNGLSLRFGQFNVQFDREQSATSNTTLQLLERSLVNDTFEVERSQGIQLAFEQDRYKIFLTVSDGIKASSTSFRDDDEADTAFTGRAVLRFGDATWRQLGNFQGFRGDKSGGLIGAGVHWQHDGRTGSESGGGQVLQYTIDASFESDGWSIAAAFTGRVIEDDIGTLHDTGFTIQGGVFVSDQIELAARGAWLMPSDERTEPNDMFAAYTAGVNWYAFPGSFAMRVTFEVTFYPDTQADSSSLVRAPSTSTGLLGDDSGGQFVFAAGAQVMF